jgi:hypothetical protein
MAEVFAAIVMAIIGFVIGGLVGLNTEGVWSWSPYCWYGILVAWGVCICGFVAVGSDCCD